ncbi:DUF2459 domain-containing protein [Limobrevibacterium gyesilva]|nr:DUF2459 domain-containing protein [Limobrevibacterium gyesilva]
MLLIGGMAGCAGLPPPLPDDARNAPAVATIYVVEYGWHTDIVLPMRPVTGPLTRFRSIFPDAEVITFGFGERQYMQIEHVGFGDMLRAVLPGPGIIMVTAMRAPPMNGKDYAEVAALAVSQPQLDRLSDFVWDALEKTPDDRLVHIKDGPFPGRVFYGSSTTYSGGYTCNTWTAEALDSAGLAVGASGVLFAYQVMDRVNAIAARPAHMQAGGS